MGACAHSLARVLVSVGDHDLLAVDGDVLPHHQVGGHELGVRALQDLVALEQDSLQAPRLASCFGASIWSTHLEHLVPGWGAWRDEPVLSDPWAVLKPVDAGRLGERRLTGQMAAGSLSERTRHTPAIPSATLVLESAPL